VGFGSVNIVKWAPHTTRLRDSTGPIRSGVNNMGTVAVSPTRSRPDI
jgi:hypothetical protein